MFFLNLGYRRIEADLEGIRGVVLLPSNSDQVRVSQATYDYQRFLLDPQMYLAGLDAHACTRACARLATFPWFLIPDVPEFDPSVMGKRDWFDTVVEQVPGNWPGVAPTGRAIQEACRSCIELQLELGCSHIILPSPLIMAREDEVEIQAQWLDASLDILDEQEIPEPALATVAVDEAVLNEDAFIAAGFLDTIVDQVTARGGLNGVYILICQTHRHHPFDTNDLVLRCYLHLSQAFSRSGLENIVANFADLYGFACMAVGATGFATGHSQGLRLLSFENFQEGSFGRALPHLYSHRALAEFSSETDLNALNEHRLLRRVRDRSPFSEPLMVALERGESAASLAAWAESQNNCTAAYKHFVHRVNEEANALSGLSTTDERYEQVRNWIEDADANNAYISRRVGRLVGKVAPAEPWLARLDSMTA